MSQPPFDIERNARGKIEITSANGSRLLLLSEDEAMKLGEALKLIALSQCRKARLKPSTVTHFADVECWP